MELTPGGRIRAFVGLLSHGQGHLTALAQVLARELDVAMEDVEIVEGDTESVPYGMGSNASRSAVLGGGAVIQTARALQEKILRVASRVMDREVEALELGRGGVRERGRDGGTALSLAEIAARAQGPDELQATSRYALKVPVVSNGTHLVLGEIDPDSGRFTILRYLVVEDCGQVINPEIVEGQTYGGVAQGLGGVILEHMVYDADGQPLATTLMDYLLPTATDVPHIDVHHIENPSEETLGGFKPAGEGGVMGSVAAITNAIADALSPFEGDVTELPLEPSRVLRHMGTIR